MPAWRDKEFPPGRPDLSTEQADKVRLDNAMLEIVMNLVQEAERLSLFYLVENPLNSWTRGNGNRPSGTSLWTTACLGLLGRRRLVSAPMANFEVRN